MASDPRPSRRPGPLTSIGFSHETTTSVLYSSITVLGVILAATAKDYIADSWDLGLLVLGSVIALAAAHAWAGVMGDVLADGRELSRRLVLSEVRHSLTMLLPVLLVILTLFLVGLTTASFDVAITAAMLVVVVVLFFAGYFGAHRQHRSVRSSISWGAGSAALGLTAVLVKVLVGA